MVMYRYVTLLWNRRDAEAGKAAEFIGGELQRVSPHAWRRAWAGVGVGVGVTVFDSGEHKGRMQTYRLQNGAGVVLGRLFKKDYTSQIADLDDAESRACLTTKGQHLIDHYWGRYVAFLYDQAAAATYVMRDPTGAFPCFHTPYRGVEIYFSDMQDIARFEFLRFTVNWEYLRTNLLLPQFQKIHTGLNEVGEVLPAECVEITPFERRSRFVWDPIKISETDVVEDIEAAASLLCSTVRNTVHALAGCYDSVVHNLGGLDSSILLACLAQAPKRPEIAAINYFTKSPRGDERRYARQAASKFGVELVEAELDYRKADLNRVFTSNKLVSPLGFFDCVALTGDVLGLARKKDAQALFYGVGGDNVYFQPSFNVGALDYVQRRGLLGGGLIRIAMEASRYGRISLLKTLAAMLRERFMPAPCWDYVHDLFFRNLRLPLIHPDFLAGDAAQFLHPLLRPNDHDLKGKYIHILMTSFFSIEYYDHWDTEYRAERIHAYLAQPIIEACLRIPVWVMTHGGVDRGLARKVFRDDLPRDVVGRLSKSTPETYYDDIYLNNVGFIREYLLDGVLVREGVLAHDKLEAALAMTSIQQQVIKFQILFYLGTEAWLRGCMEKPVQEAARLKSAT